MGRVLRDPTHRESCGAIMATHVTAVLWNTAAPWISGHPQEAHVIPRQPAQANCGETTRELPKRRKEGNRTEPGPHIAVGGVMPCRFLRARGPQDTCMVSTPADALKTASMGGMGTHGAAWITMLWPNDRTTRQHQDRTYHQVEVSAQGGHHMARVDARASKIARHTATDRHHREW